MVRPSPTGGFEQVVLRHAEVLEDQAVVVGLPQGVQTVGLTWKCSFSSGGRSTISTAGLPSISTTRPTVRPGMTLVMNSFSPLTT